MAVRSTSVYVRLEPDVKEQAENVLAQLGLPMSSAIALFLRQVILNNGLPFAVKLPAVKPLFYEELSEEQFNAEIEKGLADMRAGRDSAAEDVMERLSSELGL